MRSWLACCALIAVMAALAGIAHADPKVDAKKYFERGVELVDNNQLVEAAEAFQKAYKLAPHYSVLYNLGRVYIALGKPVEAQNALSGYLRDGGDAVEDARRQEVEGLLAELAPQVGELQLTVEPTGARVHIDGRPIALGGASVPLAVGTHTIEVDAPGHRSRTERVVITSKQQQSLSIVLRPASSEPVETPEPDAAEDDDTGTLVAIILGASGVALAGATLGIGLWNDGRYRDWEAEQLAIADARSTGGAVDARQAANDEVLGGVHGVDGAVIGLGVACGALMVAALVVYVVTDDAPTEVGWRW